ncbi:unnamed protein product, partial [marine sediment metagenome]
ELSFASKFVDHGMNTTSYIVNQTPAWKANANSLGYDQIYSLGNPGIATNNSRWQNNSDSMHFNLSTLTESWLAMYNGSTGNGFIVDWGHFDYADRLTRIDWSDGEIDVKYSFENFPLEGIDQILIPIQTTDTAVMANNRSAWMRDYVLEDFEYYLREVWLSTVTEKEIEIEIETETEIETTEVEVTVEVTVEVISTYVTTHFESSTPGFEMLPILAFSVLAGAIYVFRRRRY